MPSSHIATRWVSCRASSLCFVQDTGFRIYWGPITNPYINRGCLVPPSEIVIQPFALMQRPHGYAERYASQISSVGKQLTPTQRLKVEIVSPGKVAREWGSRALQDGSAGQSAGAGGALPPPWRSRGARQSQRLRNKADGGAAREAKVGDRVGSGGERPLRGKADGGAAGKAESGGLRWRWLAHWILCCCRCCSPGACLCIVLLVK